MKTIIIGGGIAGLTTAIALRKIGIESLLFEAAPAIKPVGAGLGLAANAIKGFRKLGIADEVIQVGRTLPSFTIYDQQGAVITHTNSLELSRKFGLDNFTVHRADLHRVLLAQLDPENVFTNRKAVGVEQQTGQVTVRFADGSSRRADALIVADGIHSPIRQQLLPDLMPRYAGYTCWRAVIDNSVLQVAEASETWGLQGRFGLVPLADDRLYWFACLNAPRQDARMKAFRTGDLLRNFREYRTPIPEVLHHTRDEQLLWNDILDLPPLPHYAFGHTVLLGDAAHATTPNMGQGASQAIEDAVVLADELAKDGHAAAAFRRFEQRRRQRTQSVTRQSRLLGRLAQTENKWLASLRNGLFRLMPSSLNERRLADLYAVDF